MYIESVELCCGPVTTILALKVLKTGPGCSAGDLINQSYGRLASPTSYQVAGMTEASHMFYCRKVHHAIGAYTFIMYFVIFNKIFDGSFSLISNCCL